MNPEARGPELAPYLTPGPTQRRLADDMARGHARHRHGRELGDLDVVRFRRLAERHLSRAPRAYAVDTPAAPRCYLVTDARSGLVAWIPPHKPHRSTIFRPESGVERFVTDKRRNNPRQRWTELDAGALRGTARAAARGIASRDRRPPANLGR